MTAKSPRPPRIVNAARTCPECGAGFTAHHGRQLFCTPGHQTAFHQRNARRGKVALPLLQVWRRGKNGRTEDTAYAFQQLCALADMWNAEDRTAGRRPDLTVTTKRLSLWNFADVT